MRRLAMGLIGAAIMVAPAFAQDQCENDKLVIGTGTPAGTYAQMFQSVAAKCTMVCENRKTQGGLDNITQIIKKQFDGGIVQVDTLDLVNRTVPSIKQSVRSLFSLHGSSMHVFAMKQGFKSSEDTWGGLRSKTVYTPINTLQDLKGKPVAAWSSAFGTAQLVDERLKLNMDVREYTDRKKGLADLKSGVVAAFMGMGGYPLDWVEKNTGESAEIGTDMVMVSASSDDISRLGQPYYGQKAMYRSIGALGVNMVTVRNELVIWNIQSGPRARAVAEFQSCFKSNLEDIKDARNSHPSWQDVSLDTPLSWEPYRASAGQFQGPLPPTRR